MNGIDKSSTQRAQRFRQRKLDAGNRRITLYLDRDTQHRLDHLAGGKAQAAYLGPLVEDAVRREWAALERRQHREHSPQSAPTNPAVFPGRRRRLANS